MTQQCSQCKEPAAEGRKMCTRHVEYHRDYAARKAAGKIHPVKKTAPVKDLPIVAKPKPMAPVVEIEVGPSSIDEAIAKLEQDLQALKNAKVVMQRLEVA